VMVASTTVIGLVLLDQRLSRLAAAPIRRGYGEPHDDKRKSS
jgi:hypothetical protein